MQDSAGSSTRGLIRLFALALLGLGIGVVAVAGSATADKASAAVIVPVSIDNFAYSPAMITINVGDTVTWTNNQVGVAHTVTAKNGTWDSGVVMPGDTFSFTFTKAGTYQYFCDIHPFMHGQVKVRSGED